MNALWKLLQKEQLSSESITQKPEIDRKIAELNKKKNMALAIEVWKAITEVQLRDIFDVDKSKRAELINMCRATQTSSDMEEVNKKIKNSIDLKTQRGLSELYQGTKYDNQYNIQSDEYHAKSTKLIKPVSQLISQLQTLRKYEFEDFLSDLSKIKYLKQDNQPKKDWLVFYGKDLIEAQLMARRALISANGDSFWAKVWTATSDVAETAVWPKKEASLIKKLFMNKTYDDDYINWISREAEEIAVLARMDKNQDVRDAENRLFDTAEQKEWSALIIATSSRAWIRTSIEPSFDGLPFPSDPREMKVYSESYMAEVPLFNFNNPYVTEIELRMTTRQEERVRSWAVDELPHDALEKIAWRNVNHFLRFRAAADAALMARLIILEDVKFEGKLQYTNYAKEIMEVWKKGYCLAGDVNGTLYVYGVGKPPEGINLR